MKCWGTCIPLDAFWEFYKHLRERLLRLESDREILGESIKGRKKEKKKKKEKEKAEWLIASVKKIDLNIKDTTNR